MQGSLPVAENVTYDSKGFTFGDLSEMNADQYLSWVREEAERLGPVSVAEGITDRSSQQSKYMPQLDEIASCAQDLIPDDQWVQEAIYTFSELRRTLGHLAKDPVNKERTMRVPPMKHDKSWLQFCLGLEPSQEKRNAIKEEDSGDSGAIGNFDGSCPFTDNEEAGMRVHLAVNSTENLVGEGNKRKAGYDDQEELVYRKKLLAERMGLEPESSPPPGEAAVRTDVSPVNGAWKGNTRQLPTTALLLQFDQVLTQRLLDLHAQWLVDYDPTRPLELRGLAEAEDGLELRGQWLYGLLARLEKPLYHQAAAVVRRLFRCCCELRARLSKQSGTFSADLAALNVLISICGSYFGQSETQAALPFDEDGSEEDFSGGEEGQGEEISSIIM